MSEINVRSAREEFADLLNRARYAKERIRLTRHGRAVAALVPVEDLEMIEALEDRIDLEDARKALVEMKRKGEKPIPLAEVKKRLGL